MTRGSGCRTTALILVPLVFFAALLVAGIGKKVLVLEIEGPNVVLPVSEGDVFLHTYTHSMYGVPVQEKFRIQDGHFRLVHIMTQSDAVLAYLGIEGKDEPNVDETFREFTIPAASVGNHAIRVRGTNVPLGTHEGRGGRVRVSIVSIPVLVYLAHLVWS